MAFGVSGESAFKGLFVLLLVSLLGAAFIAYGAVTRPLDVTVTAPAVNVVQPTPQPVHLSTGALGGEAGLSGSSITYMTDCPNPIKKSIPVPRYPRPPAYVVRDNLVSFMLANGSMGGIPYSIGNIQVYNGTISPTDAASLTLSLVDSSVTQIPPIGYVALNDSSATTQMNTSSNLSVNTNVPIVVFKILVPTSNFNNMTLQFLVNGSNLSAPGLRINVTSLVYNFTLGGFQYMNVSGVEAVSATVPYGNMTLNASLQGNLSSQLINNGFIYVAMFPGNATLNATTLNPSTINVNGSNTSLSVGWVSGNFYSNTSAANYSLNVSLYNGGANTAANVSIYGVADNGNLVREYLELSNDVTPATARFGTHITVVNFSEIYLIYKNTSSGGNVSLAYTNGTFFASLNSTSTNGVLEAYPCVTYNGTQLFTNNHSVVTDAVDVSAYHYCTAYVNMTTGTAQTSTSTVWTSPDNKTWVTNGMIGGAFSTTILTKYLPINDTSARFVRVNMTSSGVTLTPMSMVLACKN